MLKRSAEAAFRPVKPSSVKTDGQKQGAIEEYRAEHEAALNRMAKQRAAPLSAGELVRMKNRKW